jgi:hypothetical protein
MLDEDDLKILRHIDSKVVVYPHEVADVLWPKDPNRNLRIGSHLKTLESGGYVIRRGDKKNYIVGTKLCEKLLAGIDAEAAIKSAVEKTKTDPLFG